MSEDSLDKLILFAKDYHMSVWEQRAQAIGFAVGNLMATRNHIPPDEWIARMHAANAWEEKNRLLTIEVSWF